MLKLHVNLTFAQFDVPLIEHKTFSRLAEYDACARLGQTLMEKITERNKHNRTSSQYTKVLIYSTLEINFYLIQSSLKVLFNHWSESFYCLKKFIYTLHEFQQNPSLTHSYYIIKLNVCFVFQLSAQIRVSMKQFNQSLNKLKQTLVRASSSYHMYP